MGRNDRWKNGWELVWILALIYAVSATPTCTEDQKLRRNENDVICCYTARCNTSQRFEFCKQHQGHDKCFNCPPNSYTNDEIDTAQWDEESDVCVLKPPCNSDEVISIGNECACNLAKGYWGVDSRNCQLDKYNCKRAGHQLRQKDGACINCDVDKFKPEDTYGVCQNKTKCKAGEKEVDGGSTERDRKCQAIQIDTASTLAPPTITTNTEPPNEEKKNDDEKSIIVWLLPVCGVFVALICVAVCLWWKCRIRIQESFGHLCSEHPDTRNRPPNQELRPMNGISQNHKHSNCNSNGSVNPDEQPLFDSSENAETDAPQTFLKPIGGSDEQYSSFGESIFDNEKSTSLEQNNRSLIGTQMSTTLNHETSHGNTNNTGGNSVYDTAMTGFTGNIPESDLFHNLNTTQNLDNGEGPKTKAASSMTGNTEAPTNKTRPMATARTGSSGNTPESGLFHSLNTTATPNRRDISNSKATSSVTGNTEAPTNKTRPTATASHVTGNTQPPTKPMVAVRPLPRPGSSTSSRSQENTAPDNNDQRFPASPTTDGGNDIQAAVNEENSKFVPSHVNRPPDELSGNDDSIVTETGSEPIHVNMDDVNRHLQSEETSESLEDDETASRNVIETESESQLTGLGNILAAPESTSTTSSNEPSLPSVESENPDSITESEGNELTSRETTFQ